MTDRNDAEGPARVLSDEQLCAVALAVLGDDYTDPDGEDLALSRAIEQAALRELAQGVDVEALALSVANEIEQMTDGVDGDWDDEMTAYILVPIAAALTRAIAGERAKASAREAQALKAGVEEGLSLILSLRGTDTDQQALDHICYRLQSVYGAWSNQVAAATEKASAALRAQLLGAPDGE
jgi:hypothetical protein